MSVHGLRPAGNHSFGVCIANADISGNLVDPDESFNLYGPPFQCLALFVHIRVAIVDGGDAGDDTCLVVQHGLDDVRLDTHNRHVGCGGAPKVMEAPIISIEADNHVEALLETSVAGDRRPTVVVKT